MKRNQRVFNLFGVRITKNVPDFRTSKLCPRYDLLYFGERYFAHNWHGSLCLARSFYETIFGLSLSKMQNFGGSFVKRANFRSKACRCKDGDLLSFDTRHGLETIFGVKKARRSGQMDFNLF